MDSNDLIARHPAAAAPTWPTDEQGSPLVDEGLYLLAGLINHMPEQRRALLGLADHVKNSPEWPHCCRDLLAELEVAS
jgi:hypothetical protein